MTGQRCRWFLDTGRCTSQVTAPGVAQVPELCPAHLHALMPWARTQAARPNDAEGWIAYMARRAGQAEAELRLLGVTRPPRALDDGRDITPRGPERR